MARERTRCALLGWLLAAGCAVPQYSFDGAVRTDASLWQCGTQEVDLRSDLNNCGACGSRCLGGPNRLAVCANLRCETPCMPGWGDCDNDPSNGCEVQLSGDAHHCGSCGTVCMGPAGTMGTCNAGLCDARCPDGFGDCDGDTGNGCETNLRTSADHCGRCEAAPCAAGVNATPQCSAGACTATCRPGYASCDGDLSNGCEVDTTTSMTNCGGCGMGCASDRVCNGGACVMPCPNPGEVRCGGASGVCASTSSDPLHCGASCRACTVAAGGHGSAQCTNGVCDVRCDSANYANCDADPATGCEANLATDVNNCGACHTRCAFANAAATCVGGACVLGACAPGFGNCDGNAANGCETALNTPAHCGSCAACAGGNATWTCTGGACQVASCGAGFADCNMGSTDGCEVSTSANNQNCGRCGVVCASGLSCVAGACVSSCTTPGYGLCGGVCYQTSSDLQHCGAGCLRCTGGVNTTPQCVAGACSAPCNTGYGDCNSNAGDGCETPLNTPAHCNGCGTVCPAPAAGTGVATCTSGACGITCNPGYLLMGTSCVAIPAPRPRAPGSTMIANHQRPTFSFVTTAPATSGVVELSLTPSFSSLYLSLTGAAGAPSVQPAVALPQGVLYWRVRGAVGSNVGTATSPVWSVVIPGRNPAVPSTAWLQGADLNGDGLYDVAVGAPGSAAGGADQVFIYYAGLSGGYATLPAPSGALGFGTSVSAAGDVNGDGIGDLLVGACYVEGGPTRTPLIVYSQCQGTAYVYYGRAGAPSTTLLPTMGAMLGTDAAGAFGYAVAGAGDVNGDGYADVAVGAWAGRYVRVYHGGPTGVSTTAATQLNGPANSDFGISVSTAGDVDMDGFADLVVGAPYFFSTGSPGPAAGGTVYPGSMTAGIRSAPMGSLTDTGNRFFGISVALAGDVDADGDADVVVSGNAGGGFTAVYRSTMGSVPSTPAVTWTGGGVSSSGVGDVDGDGADDVVVGSSGGTAWLYRGVAGSAPGATPFRTFTVAAPVGRWIAPAGFVSSDNYADFLLGGCASRATCGTSVGIVHGAATAAYPTMPVYLTAPSGAALYGHAVALGAPVRRDRWGWTLGPRRATPPG